MSRWIKRLCHSLSDLCFPRRCPVCGGRLVGHDECVCLTCMGNLPHTLYHLRPGNRLEQRFYGTVPIERATGYFFYSPDSPYHHILHELKYYHHQKMALYMGRCMALYISLSSSFFEGIDYLIPVPLSSKRMRQRGYNQCELIAQGISEVVHIPLLTGCVVRQVDNATQTRRTHTERWQNVSQIFSAGPDVAMLHGKHILLIDDIVTTGATLTECAKVIHAALPDCHISIATLGVTAFDG